MKYGFMILTLWISACASLTVYSESQAIDLVMKSIERNQLTVLKTECLMFVVENKTTFYEIDVREKHNQHCGGDPTIAPRLFTYQVNKQTGSMKIDEPISGGQYMDIN